MIVPRGIRNGALPSGEEEIRNEEATFAPACTSTIAIIKFSSITAGYIRQKKLVSVHSVLNKAAGLLLFVFPLTLAFMDLRYSAAVVCMAATAAAIQEGFTVHEKNCR